MPIRCQVVTPERTELDREAEFVALPMFDGELGVLPGRAPLIGRLGFGTLRLQTAAGPERYFVDGGFAEVENDVVTVLTARLVSVDLLDARQIQASLDEAVSQVPTTAQEMEQRDTAIRRARGQLQAIR